MNWFQDVEKKTFSKTLNEKCKAIKDIEKGLSNKGVPKNMNSHPIQFRLRSEIKRTISKLWKTTDPAKNEN